MKYNSLTTRLLALAIASLSAACAADDNFAVEEEDIGTLEGAVGSSNAMTLNSLTLSSLTTNATTADSMTANPLTASALMANSLVTTALQNEVNSRSVMYYIVGCALDADQEISLDLDSGMPLTYHGSIGLAPEWGQPGGHCGEECKGWVSACVIARLNYLGERVAISIRGSHEALQLAPGEAELYPVREATYFGSIFSTPQVRKACYSPGSEVITRVCGSSNKNCGVNVVGSCTSLCDAPAADGSFSRCAHSPLDTALSPVGRSQQAVTVFLQE